jgi:hypothetical protein
MTFLAADFTTTTIVSGLAWLVAAILERRERTNANGNKAL